MMHRRRRFRKSERIYFVEKPPMQRIDGFSGTSVHKVLDQMQNTSIVHAYSITWFSEIFSLRKMWNNDLRSLWNLLLMQKVKWNKSSHARRHFTWRSHISPSKAISQIRKDLFRWKTADATHRRFFWHILHNLIQCNAVSPSVAFVKRPFVNRNTGGKWIPPAKLSGS